VVTTHNLLLHIKGRHECPQDLWHFEPVSHRECCQAPLASFGGHYQGRATEGLRWCLWT